MSLKEGLTGLDPEQLHDQTIVAAAQAQGEIPRTGKQLMPGDSEYAAFSFVVDELHSAGWSDETVAGFIYAYSGLIRVAESERRENNGA